MIRAQTARVRELGLWYICMWVCGYIQSMAMYQGFIDIEIKDAACHHVHGAVSIVPNVCTATVWCLLRAVVLGRDLVVDHTEHIERALEGLARKEPAIWHCFRTHVHVEHECVH